MKVWMNGQLVDQADAHVNVFDHGLLYGDGVFEGIRSYHGKIFQCEAHLDRLYRSAERIRLEIPYAKDELTDAMTQTLAANDLTDGSYIRLVVTRGPGKLGLNPYLCKGCNVFVIADQVRMYDDAMYENGMAVIIAKTRRRPATVLDPRIKSLNYLNNIMAKMEACDAGVLEAVMLNPTGDVSECTGDNIFIVEDGAVITPPSEAGILLGITRSVVIYLAGQLGIPLRQERILPERLLGAQECFLTGTAAEVIAVTAVDGKTIGHGQVGPITQTLLDAFHEFTKTDTVIPYEE
jgi:branched-chain amino acid aminotransferase